MKPAFFHRFVGSGMRAACHLAGSIACLLAATARAGTNVVVADDFNNNGIDGAKWTISNPNGYASGSETGSPNGYITSANRANILTVGGVSWDPASASYGGQHLSGTFFMAADSNRSQGDAVNIYTRSSNANNGGGAVSTQYGIDFGLGEGSHQAGVDVVGYPNTWIQAPTKTGDTNLGSSTNYQQCISFDFWDFGDGRYAGTFTQMAGANAGMTSTVTAISSTTGSYAGQVNQVNMHSRERSNNYSHSHQSNFDDVVVAAPSSWLGTGGGSWSGSNWSGGNGVAAHPSGAGTAVVFGKPGSVGTVNLDIGSTLGVIAFYPEVNTTLITANGSALTLDNRPLTATADTGALAGITVLGGAHVILPDVSLTNSVTVVVFNSADSLTLGGTVSGLGYDSLYTLGRSDSVGGNGISKGGEGTLVLTGANTYGGVTRITLGTLSVGNPLALRNSTVDMNPAFSGTLGFGAAITTATLGGLAGSRDVTLLNADNNGVNLAVGNNHADTSYAGCLSDAEGLTAGGLTKVGAGTLTLTGSHSYTGATTIRSGTLQIDFSASVWVADLIGAGSPLVLNGGNLTLTGDAYMPNSQAFASLTVDPGAAAVRLSANDTANPLLLSVGAITHHAGGLVNFTLPTGIQDSSNGIITSTGNGAGGILGAWATVGGTDPATGYPTDYPTDYATVAAGNIVAYSGYTDVTRLNGGPQVIAGNAATNIRIIEGTGSPASIRLTSPTTISTLNQSETGGTGAATLNLAGQTLTLNGILVGGGAGELTVGIGTGSLRSAGTELSVNNGNTATINAAITDGTGGASALTKAGSGTLVLAGTNTHTGPVTILAGMLQLGAAGNTTYTPLGTAAAGTTVYAGAALDLNGYSVRTAEALTLSGTGASDSGALTNSSSTAASYGGLITLGSASSIVASNGSITLGTPGTLAGAGFALTLGGDAPGSSLASSIGTGTGTLTKTGYGTWTLAGANTYTGLTHITAGTLALGIANAIHGAIAVAGATAELSVGAFNNTSTAVTLDDGGSITGSSGVLKSTAGFALNSGAVTAILGGTSGVRKASGGTVVLAGLNTYAGLTLLSAGTLNINSDAALGAVPAAPSTTLAFDGNAALQFATDASLNANRDMDISSGVTATFDTQTYNSTIRGRIGGSGNLTKSGEGILTLTGVNTYAGSTNITAGALQVNGALGSGGLVSVPAGGTLSVGSSGVIGRDVTVSGGILNLAGALAAGTTLKVTGGTVTTTGSQASVATADFSAGLGTVDASGFPLILTNQLKLANGLVITLGGGGTAFTLSGASLASPSAARTLTAAGGVLTLARPSYPTDGLLGKWTFDGQTAADTSGNGHHGTEMASPSYSTDTHTGTGYALNLTGSNYVKVDTGGSQSVFDGGRAMTLSAWVKGWPGGWNPFISKNGESNGWQMRRHGGDNTLDWTARGLDSNGGSDFPSNTTSVANGQWHMVTMTYDGVARKIFVDGAIDATRNNTETMVSTPSLLLFGARDNGTVGNFFTGMLDDICFYNRALSAAEIATAYTGSGGSSGADLAATDLAVTASSEVALPAGTTTLGKLSLGSAASALTLSGAAATGASFATIEATATVSITAGVPILLRAGGVTVAASRILTVSAHIVDGAAPTALDKLGAGTLTLAGINTYTGDTTVTAGTLTLAADAGLKFAIGDTSNNKITGAGTVILDGGFTIDTSAVSNTAGIWALVDTTDKSFGASFTVVGAGWTETADVWTKPHETDPSKSWSFSEATGVLTLAVGSAAPYDLWIASKGLSGGAALPSADPDHDGVSNALEFVLGGEPNPANAGSNSSGLLPAVTRNAGGDLIFTFRRKDLSESAAALTFQWSADLAFPVANNVAVGAVSSATGGVGVVVNENSPDAATDTIVITVPAAKAVGGKLFGRLGAAVTSIDNVGTAYEIWIAAKGLTGPVALPYADPDQDGLANALEFVLGGEPNPANSGSNSSNLLPAVSQSGGNLAFSFRRKDLSEGASTLTFQWSTDLSFPPANDVAVGALSSTTDGVGVAVTENTPDADTDAIVISVPLAKAAGGKLFGRLRVTVP